MDIRFSGSRLVNLGYCCCGEHYDGYTLSDRRLSIQTGGEISRIAISYRRFCKLIIFLSSVYASRDPAAILKLRV